LNKLPSLNLPGDGDAVGVASAASVFFFRVCFSFGEAEADALLSAAGDAAGLASASVFFLRVCFSFGEAEADALLSAAGDAVALASALSAFL
jgi:hypothetical protein